MVGGGGHRAQYAPPDLASHFTNPVSPARPPPDNAVGGRAGTAGAPTGAHRRPTGPAA